MFKPRSCAPGLALFNSSSVVGHVAWKANIMRATLKEPSLHICAQSDRAGEQGACMVCKPKEIGRCFDREVHKAL